MERQNDNSDKTTFKVKHLGEYHDIVIDWNDDRFLYKALQLYDQLESITGIPSRYNDKIYLYDPFTEGSGNLNTYDINRRIEHPERNGPSKDEICDAISFAEGRFHLVCEVTFVERNTNHIFIEYSLIPERVVPEGGCRHRFCRYKNTKSFFNKLKDIVNNDQLNAKMASLVPTSGSSSEICRRFNIRQYFRSSCNARYWEVPNAEARRVFCDMNLYLRTRG
ncbi:uncharacterized protein LOC107367861 [Tetranychus urticae]|uniref:Uncharacterized protein n=1 Tax=Tetranychus urticae TaxID=32264 RepID=T1KW83_TETUR|nr:uncharacterized protein LOC107367861 [Tetranychus urticae]